MNMPNPSPGHLLLEKLAGSWVGEEIMHPSQWDPKGGVAIGRNNHKLSLGGFALLADYEQERDGAITFTGHGVYTYDPKEGVSCCLVPSSREWSRSRCSRIRPATYSGSQRMEPTPADNSMQRTALRAATDAGR